MKHSGHEVLHDFSCIKGIVLLLAVREGVLGEEVLQFGLLRTDLFLLLLVVFHLQLERSSQFKNLTSPKSLSLQNNSSYNPYGLDNTMKELCIDFTPSPIPIITPQPPTLTLPFNNPVPTPSYSSRCFPLVINGLCQYRRRLGCFQHVYYFKPTYNTYQRISMEAEQDFKKDYEEILVIYSKRKTDNDTLLKNIGKADSNIATLTSELSNYALNPSTEEVKEDRSELQALHSKIQQLENEIKQRQTDIDHAKAEFTRTVEQLRNEASHHAQPSAETHSAAAEELAAINNQVIQAKKTYEGEAHKVHTLSNEITEDQSILKLLLAQLAELSKGQSQASHHQADQSNLQLEKELKELSKELETLTQSVVAEQKNADSERKKLQQSIKSQKAALAAESSKVNDLKQQQKSLQQKLASNDNDRLNQLQAEVKKLQNQNQQLQKDIDRLAQSIQTKKAEKAAHQEQLRKYKEKKEKNYKLEIAEAEKTTINLNKELQREKEKLSDVSKLSRSYVSQQNLQILQKELNRHQSASTKTSIETEENKLKKYLKENQNLKTRIQTLKTASRKLEQETETIVRTLKQSGDQLVKEKLAQEKVFNQSTNKLNEYMKEYPDHEKKKEQQKLEQKKRRAEEKERVREAAREEREKKKEELKAKKTEQVGESEDNPNLPAWEQWDKWQGKNLPARDQTSIFNNRQFQLAAGAIALLAILLLTFG